MQCCSLSTCLKPVVVAYPFTVSPIVLLLFQFLILMTGSLISEIPDWLAFLINFVFMVLTFLEVGELGTVGT